MALIIRLILTVIILIAVYFETGPFTALTLFLVALRFEVDEYADLKLHGYK